MNRQRGVTIVEGLVALVILSVGMLGIASLYVASLKTGRTALTRTQAVNLVNDLLDSIRANGTAEAAYAFSGNTPPEPGDCGGDGVCTAAQLAQNDLNTWVSTAVATLPGLDLADVTFTDGAAAPDVYTVSLRWIETGETFNYRASVEMLRVTP